MCCESRNKEKAQYFDDDDDDVFLWFHEKKLFFTTLKHRSRAMMCEIPYPEMKPRLSNVYA